MKLHLLTGVKHCWFYSGKPKFVGAGRTKIVDHILLLAAIITLAKG